MREEKILENQLVLEKRALDVLDRYEKLVSNNKHTDIFEVGLVPLYLMLASAENGMDDAGLIDQNTLVDNLKCIYKTIYLLVAKYHHGIIYDGNLLARQHNILTEVNFPKLSKYSYNQATEYVEEVKRYFTLSANMEKKIKINLNYWIGAQYIAKLLVPRLRLNEIHVGTGSKPMNQIVCIEVKKQNGVVERYSHGGDRGFFNDQLFYRSEFRNTDRYHVHGLHEANGLDAPVDIKIAGSIYHATLDKQSNSRGKWGDEVIYCLHSNVGSNAHYPLIKFSDENQTLIQLNIIKLLKGRGYFVKLKHHPKGGKIDQRVYDLSDGVIEGTMEECLASHQNWVFDLFASAGIEALSARKNIVYFDLSLRKRSKYFDQLRKRVFICEAFDLPTKKVLKAFFEGRFADVTRFTQGFYR